MEMELLFVAIIGILLLGIAMAPTEAFQIAGSLFKVFGAADIGGGVTPASVGPGNRVYMVVGQPAQGFVAGSTYKGCIGLYCVFEALDISLYPYTVHVSGTLLYNNNTVVRDSDVKLTIRYGTNKWSNTTRSDSGGYFDAHTGIPPSVYDKDFRIEIYVADDIEALYGCNYDQATEQCAS